MTLQQFRFLYQVLTGVIPGYRDVKDRPGNVRTGLMSTFQACREKGWVVWDRGDDFFSVTQQGFEEMQKAFPEFWTPDLGV